MATIEFKKRIRIITVKDFRAKFSTEEECLKYLVKHRWPNGFVCPKCHNREAHWQAGRSIYWCKACEYQVSVTAGTVFHSTNLGLPDWFWAVYRMAQGKKGFSANCSRIKRELKSTEGLLWTRTANNANNAWDSPNRMNVSLPTCNNAPSAYSPARASFNRRFAPCCNPLAHCGLRATNDIG